MVKYYTRGGLFGSCLLDSDFDGLSDEDYELGNFPEAKPCIYVDDMTLADRDVLEFTIYHEYGHIVNDHQRIINEKFGCGELYASERSKGENSSILSMELEADKYAVDMIGREAASKALNALVDCLHSEFPEYESEELEIRRKELECA